MIIVIVIALLFGLATGLVHYSKHPKDSKNKREAVALSWMVAFLVIVISFLASVVASLIMTSTAAQPAASSHEIQQATERYKIVDSRLYDQKEHRMATDMYDVTFSDVDYPIVEIKVLTWKGIGGLVNPFKISTDRQISVTRVILPRNINTSTLTDVKVQDTYKSPSDTNSGQEA